MESFEQDHPLDAGGIVHTKQLQVTDQITKYWLEIATWCTFFGVFYLIIALVILMALMNKDNLYLSASVGGNISFPISLIIYTVCGLLYWRIGYVLQQGCNRSETAVIERGFHQLYLLYTVTGIMTILSLLPLFYAIYTVVKSFMAMNRF